MKPAMRWLLGMLTVAVLLEVFAMYGQPDFLFQMANQLWACF
jgi:hypothetical protein